MPPYSADGMQPFWDWLHLYNMFANILDNRGQRVKLKVGNRGIKRKRGMKQRSTQFGVRKNPDSPRVHGLRLGSNRASSEQTSQHSVGDEPSPPRLPPREKGLDRSPRMHQSRHAPGQASVLVDIHEAARYLAVSESTLYGWVWQRRISFVKVGRAVRFDVADLKQFVDENRIPARRVNGL
jgi:excisionase family DNA binding protein